MPQMNPAIQPVESRPLNVSLRPSESGDPLYVDRNGDSWAGGNYLLNGGSGRGTNYCASGNDGLFWRGSRTKFRDITDGTSNTVFMAETRFGNRAPDTTILRDHQRQMKRVSAGSPCSMDASLMPPLRATRYEGVRAGVWILCTGSAVTNTPRNLIDAGFRRPGRSSPSSANPVSDRGGTVIANVQSGRSVKKDRRCYWLNTAASGHRWSCVHFEKGRYFNTEGTGNPF